MFVVLRLEVAEEEPTYSMLLPFQDRGEYVGHKTLEPITAASVVRTATRAKQEAVCHHTATIKRHILEVLDIIRSQFCIAFTALALGHFTPSGHME